MSLASAIASSTRPVAVQRDDRPERLARAGEHVLGDAVEDRRLEERRAEVGAGPAAGEHGGALGHRVLDVGGAPGRGGPPRPASPAPARSRTSHRGAGPRRRRRTSPGTRRRASRARRSARCACRSGRCCGRRRTAAPATTSSRFASSSTIIGFLPPSSRQQPIRLRPARSPIDPAGGGRAGEHHVVGVVDQRRPDVGPSPQTTWKSPFGSPAFSSRDTPYKRRQRGLVVGLEDDAVAGDQRGDRVGDAGREREVPRRDDADHALGLPDLGRGRHHRDRAAALGRRQQLAARA